MNKNFFNFIFLLIVEHKNKHIGVFVLSFVVAFLLLATLFVSNSIQSQLLHFAHNQTDFVISQVKSGKRELIPHHWIDEFYEIQGISNVQGRIYGQYYHLATDYSFVIVGVDLFDTYVTQEIEDIFEGIDLRKFLSQNHMLLGAGVDKFLKEQNYPYYNFLTPELDIIRVDYFEKLPQNSGIISNDFVLMDSNLARKILGIEKGMYSDIILSAPNESEWQTIKLELIDKYHNIKIITREDLHKAYTNLYNYKSGFFLILFVLLLSTLCLILYQRYSMIASNDKKEIAVLRSIGWSIKDVVVLKVCESAFIAVGSFLLAAIVAYIYIFFLGAPILKEFFLGSHNINYDITFVPFVDFSLLASLFLLFITFFIASVLVPSWKIASNEIEEVLR